MTTAQQREWIAEHKNYIDQLVSLLVSCRDVMCIDQREYKTDFFRIFSSAYRAGYCAPRYRADLQSGKWKIIAKERPLIFGDTIAEEARRIAIASPDLNCGDRFFQNLELLQVWWDEWTFAWEHNPPPERRKRITSNTPMSNCQNEI